MTSNTLPNARLRKMFSVHRHPGGSTFYNEDGKPHKTKCLKRGWLKKLGGLVRSWQQRWFVVKGDHMCYFSSEDETKTPVGRIFLPGSDVLEHPHNSADPDKYLFQIVRGGWNYCIGDRHHHFRFSAAIQY